MIQTVKYNLGGPLLQIPMVNGSMIRLPHDSYLDFGSYCGAGDGIGNWLVPEVIHGYVRISAACWIHDEARKIEPSEENFIQHNRMLRDNILAIVDYELDQIQNINDHLAACQMAMIYFGAVQKCSHIGYFKGECNEY